MKNYIGKIHKSICAFIAIISIFFFITEFDAHRPEPPPFIGSIAEPFRETGVHIQAKAYDSLDSKAYLSRDLLKKGYRPVQITIQNNTGKTYFLSKEWVDVNNVSANRVSSYVIKHYIPRSIAMKVAAFFFWPFIIPGAVDTIVTYKYHRAMKQDYLAKSLKDLEPIIPYSTTHRIVFIPEKDYTDHFHLYLKEEKSSRFLSFPLDVYS